MKSRRTILAWLAGAWLLAIPYAIFSSILLTSGIGLFLLLILPALEALLVLLLINWFSVAALWDSEKGLFSLLLAGLLLTLAATALGNIYVTLLLALPALLLALFWSVARRLGFGPLVVIGLVLVGFLLIDAAGLAGNHYIFSLARLRGAYKIASALAGLLAVALAGYCVFRALGQPSDGETRRPAGYVALAILLILSVALVNLRYAVLTKATGRAFEDHFPLGTFSAALVTGLVLLLSVKEKARGNALAFLVLAPAILVFGYSLGWRIEPRAITANRAAGIQRAIQRYYQDVGQYPDDLGALSPGYLPILLGPLTGRGQVWCYESGPGHYRLGYVVFERYHRYPDATPFTEPYYAIQVTGSAGSLPDGPWICDRELERYKEHGGL